MGHHLNGNYKLDIKLEIILYLALTFCTVQVSCQSMMASRTSPSASPLGITEGLYRTGDKREGNDDDIEDDVDEAGEEDEGEESL